MRRRKSRELALQILFALETQAQDDFAPSTGDIAQAIPLYLANFGPKNADEIIDLPYLNRLLVGVTADLSAVDREIEKYSEHWKLYRMTLIDRNILRIGVEELKNFPDIPPKVTLDECVELAKRFGSDDSSAFVNGILDKARQVLGRKDD